MSKPEELWEQAAQHAVRRYCRNRSSDRDDLLQVARVAAWQAWQGFQPGKGMKLANWLYRKACWAVMDELRELDVLPRTLRAKVKAGAAEAGAHAPWRCQALCDADVPVWPPEPLLDGVAEVEAIYRRCHLRGREVLVAEYLAAGVTQAEISRQLGVSESMVSFTVRDIREKLRRGLKMEAA